MAKRIAKPIDELSYEEAFAELEAAVTLLESGEQSLEEALAIFERGQLLTRHCSDLLARAELKVQALTADGLQAFQEGE